MKKPIYFLAAIVLVLSVSCLKKKSSCNYSDDNLTAPQSETQAVKHYLDSVGITATLHSSGFYYQVVSPGSSISPVLCSQVQVKYKGTLLNGNIFDQQYSTIFTLGSLIDGWRKGLPLISKSGEIKLYIPPSLGYGSTDVKDSYGNVVIPANSIIIFDITLLDVQ